MNTINFIVGFVVTLFGLMSIEIGAQTGADASLYSIQTNVQTAISKQVSYELAASVEYLAMAAYFGQDDVSLMGFKKFFMDNSDEEKEHAKKFVDYLNDRNGKLGELKVERINFIGSNGLSALEHALKMENKVSTHLMALHKLAQAANDVHLTDTLENDLLREQVESTRRLTGLITRLRRMSDNNNSNFAEYFIDQELLKMS